jgi:hypothetical protein
MITNATMVEQPYKYKVPVRERLRVFFKNLPCIPFSMAIRYVRRCMRKDRGLWISYQSNIAMPLYDHGKALDLSNIRDCNTIADRIMEHLFDAPVVEAVVPSDGLVQIAATEGPVSPTMKDLIESPSMPTLPLINGKKAREYLSEQFPQTIGHLLLDKWFSEAQLQLEIIARQSDGYMLRSVAAMAIAEGEEGYETLDNYNLAHKCLGQWISTSADRDRGDQERRDQQKSHL